MQVSEHGGEEPRGGDGARWSLPDGTVLFAPPGALLVEPNEGLICCHLCGRWWVSLGAHVRTHGYTAAGYREAMGLRLRVALAAKRLTSAIGRRQLERYIADPLMRQRLEVGHEMARAGELIVAAREGNATSSARAQRRNERARELRVGRETQAAVRRSALDRQVQEGGGRDLSEFLRRAYEAGGSLDSLARASGLGRAALRRALVDAGVTLRPTGANTAAGKRSRVDSADLRAAERVGADDIRGWLRERRDQGWSVARLAEAVGHSNPWVRWRLAPAPAPTETST